MDNCLQVFKKIKRQLLPCMPFVVVYLEAVCFMPIYVNIYAYVLIYFLASNCVKN